MVSLYGIITPLLMTANCKERGTQAFNLCADMEVKIHYVPTVTVEIFAVFNFC